jgi:large subunit ribosomal protein L19
MSLLAKHNEVEFGVGDTIRVTQAIEESGKKRSQAFEGIVLYIKGREENTSFCVRRIGAGQIGIERIFPLSSPTIESVNVVRSGHKGVNSAKIFYIRNKSKREIEKIYSRAVLRGDKKIIKKVRTVKISKKASRKSA